MFREQVASQNTLGPSPFCVSIAYNWAFISPESMLWRHNEFSKDLPFNSSCNFIVCNTTIRHRKFSTFRKNRAVGSDKQIPIYCGWRRPGAPLSTKTAGSRQVKPDDCGWRRPGAPLSKTTCRHHNSDLTIAARRRAVIS